MIKDIDKAYVSPYDKFLYTFDNHHEKTASQLKEIAKHQRIAELRDNAKACQSENELWGAF